MTHVAAYQSYAQLLRHLPAVAIMHRNNGRQSGMRSCIMHDLRTHLVQELKTGIVISSVHDTGEAFSFLYDFVSKHVVKKLDEVQLFILLYFSVHRRVICPTVMRSP